MVRIVIADDSRSMRGMVRAALTPDGYDITESGDGRAALTAVRALTPDLVITDVNMPDMDGITLTREIRALPEFRFTPILVLTTESDDAVKRSGRAAGATGWIVKPFDPEQLRAVVARVLRARAVPR
jgi:two-component system chemotaxis response regulator CheY